MSEDPKVILDIACDFLGTLWQNYMINDNLLKFLRELFSVGRTVLITTTNPDTAADDLNEHDIINVMQITQENINSIPESFINHPLAELIEFVAIFADGFKLPIVSKVNVRNYLEDNPGVVRLLIDDQKPWLPRDKFVTFMHPNKIFEERSVFPNPPPLLPGG